MRRLKYLPKFVAFGVGASIVLAMMVCLIFVAAKIHPVLVFPAFGVIIGVIFWAVEEFG